LSQAKYEQSVLFEHRFWLQILGDHARFIFNSLSPVEKATIKEAHRFWTEPRPIDTNKKPSRRIL